MFRYMILPQLRHTEQNMTTHLSNILLKRLRETRRVQMIVIMERFCGGGGVSYRSLHQTRDKRDRCVFYHFPSMVPTFLQS
jgi:hypothetical protein